MTRDGGSAAAGTGIPVSVASRQLSRCGSVTPRCRFATPGEADHPFLPSKLPSLVLRNPQGISRGPQPPGRWGRIPKGTAFGIGSLWRVFAYFLHVEKVGRRRRRDRGTKKQRQAANPQNARRIARCGGTGANEDACAASALETAHGNPFLTVHRPPERSLARLAPEAACFRVFRSPDLASSYRSAFPSPKGDSGIRSFVRFTVTGIVRNSHPLPSASNAGASAQKTRSILNCS